MYRRFFFALAWLLGATLGSAGESKLSIQRLMLHQGEDGPPVPTDFQYMPGDTVYFSCQVAGYQKEQKDYDKWEIRLNYSVEARDANGVLLVPVETSKIATSVSPEDKDWMPKLRFSLVVPAFAASGEYQILVNAKDENSGGEASGSVKFAVLGRDVVASDTLVVRNFRFLRSEEDQQPLQLPAYRPGDMVWARFDMTGYKLSEKNELAVDYGLTVLQPDGKVTYSQTHAAEEKTQSFYPQRYTPGTLSLSLPKDVALGEYTIVLTVHDNIGGQTYEVRERFSVE